MAYALGNTGRTGIFKNHRCDLLHLPQHFVGQSADFPLGTGAAAQAEEIQQGARIKGAHDFRFRSIGQNITSILGQNSGLGKFVIQILNFRHQGSKFSLSLRIFRNGGRNNGFEIVLLHIALGLLGIGGNAMTHQLVGQNSRNTFNGKGEGHMLQCRKMPHADQLAH